MDPWCAQCLHRNLRGCQAGKLRNAAKYWASGGKKIEDKSGADAAAFGLKLKRPAAPVEKNFDVWEENWETVMMFMRMATQWNVTMGGYVGLKYEVLVGAGGLMSLYDVDNPREMLEGIQEMESVALVELNKEKK